jgi:hypothetical protein
LGESRGLRTAKSVLPIERKASGNQDDATGFKIFNPWKKGRTLP